MQKQPDITESAVLIAHSVLVNRIVCSTFTGSSLHHLGQAES